MSDLESDSFERRAPPPPSRSPEPGEIWRLLDYGLVLIEGHDAYEWYVQQGRLRPAPAGGMEWAPYDEVLAFSHARWVAQHPVFVRGKA